MRFLLRSRRLWRQRRAAREMSARCALGCPQTPARRFAAVSARALARIAESGIASMRPAPSTGVGRRRRAPTCAIFPAVANAIFAATRKRIRKLPLKPDRVRLASRSSACPYQGRTRGVSNTREGTPDYEQWFTKRGRGFYLGLRETARAKNNSTRMARVRSEGLNWDSAAAQRLTYTWRKSPIVRTALRVPRAQK